MKHALPSRPSPLWTGLLLGLGAASWGCRAAEDTPPPMPAEEGWVTLFDGSDLDAWRGYGREDVPSGWVIDAGTLHFEPGGEGGDLVTRQSFADFELEIEWKVTPCGNSGIFYRGVQTDSLIYHTAPEMQVLDDACHPDARFPSHRAGAAYDLYMATPGVVHAGGEWNQARIVARGGHVEHWLNGQQVVTYEQGSAAWDARVAASKFSIMPDFGRARQGLIGLQDHGDPVWYRNIRVRPL